MHIAVILILCVVSVLGTKWHNADWSEYPFVVFVNGTRDKENSPGNTEKFECGGSILKKGECGHGVILTAAHCVYEALTINVYIGCTDHCGIDPNAVKYSTRMYTVHEKYDPSLGPASDRDVALVFLDCAIDKPSNAKEVYIPREHELLDQLAHRELTRHEHARAVSYGRCHVFDTNGKCAGDITLQYADFDLISMEECRKTNNIDEFEVCFLDKDIIDGMQGLCFGDSGSPIVHKSATDLQVSLVSWRRNDFTQEDHCLPDKPAVGPWLPAFNLWTRNMLEYFCTCKCTNCTDPTQRVCHSSLGKLKCSDDDDDDAGTLCTCDETNVCQGGMRRVSQDPITPGPRVYHAGVTGVYNNYNGRRRRLLQDPQDGFCCCDCGRGDDTGIPSKTPGRRRVLAEPSVAPTPQPTLTPSERESCWEQRIGRYYGDWRYDPYRNGSEWTNFSVLTPQFGAVMQQFGQATAFDCSLSKFDTRDKKPINLQNLQNVAGPVLNHGLQTFPNGPSAKGAYNQWCSVGNMHQKCGVSGGSATDIAGLLSCATEYECCLCGDVRCGDANEGCIAFTAGHYAVYGVQNINIIGSAQLGGATIECGGIEGCAESKITGENVKFVQAQQSRSLRDAMIRITDPSAGFSLQCVGERSCQGLEIEIVYSGPPHGYQCNPVREAGVVEMAQIYCYGQDACQNMKLSVTNEGCDVVEIEAIECVEPGACFGAEMDLIGPINVKYCHFTEEAPMGFALAAKCGFV